MEHISMSFYELMDRANYMLYNIESYKKNDWPELRINMDIKNLKKKIKDLRQAH
jgi:hypothetical protein